MGYHFHADFVSRGKGQSLVAKGAYQQRAKFTEERTGEVKNYSRYAEELKASLLFVHKSQRENYADAEALLNAIDKAEKHQSAQTAINITAALPAQLTDEQRLQMVRDFGREEFWRKDIPALGSIHAPPKREAEREELQTPTGAWHPNDHVHFLVGTRKLDAQGFAAKKYATWDGKQLDQMREKWAELGARYLAKAGYQIEADRWRYGHLTNEKQRDKALERGDMEWSEIKAREASQHRGPHVEAMESKGMETERGNIYRDTHDRNETVAARSADLVMLERQIAAEQERLAVRDSLKGPSRDIWEACERSTGGGELADELAERGILIARVTKEDAERSHAANDNARTRGYSAPVLKEGEYVAVTRSGDVYTFTERNTGGRLSEITGFLQQLPADNVLSVKATREIVQQVRHAEAIERATRPTGKAWDMGRDNAPLPKALVTQLRSAAFKGIEAAAQILGAAMEGIGNLFGATAITPERIEAAREQRKQQGFKNEAAAAQQEKIDIERFRRDGDYRREVQAREREKLEQETRKYYDQKDRDRDRR